MDAAMQQPGQQHYDSAADLWGAGQQFQDANQQAWYQAMQGFQGQQQPQPSHPLHPNIEVQATGYPYQHQLNGYGLDLQQQQQQQHQQQHSDPHSAMSEPHLTSEEQRQQQQFRLYLMQRQQELQFSQHAESQQQQQQQHQYNNAYSQNLSAEQLPVGTTFDSVLESYMSRPSGPSSAQSLAQTAASVPESRQAPPSWTSVEHGAVATHPQQSATDVRTEKQQAAPLFLGSSSSLDTALVPPTKYEPASHEPATSAQQQQQQQQRQMTQMQAPHPISQTPSASAATAMPAAQESHFAGGQTEKQAATSAASMARMTSTEDKHKAKTLGAVRGAASAAIRHDDLLTKQPSVIGPDESSSEPGTPPLPAPRAAASKTTGTAASSNAGSAAAASKQSKAPSPAARGTTTTSSVLLSKARPLLSPSLIDKDPANAAKQLISLLSDVDEDGKFRRPKAVASGSRKTILQRMTMEGVSERACSKAARQKYYGAWISNPAGRNILGTWLRQATPPKLTNIPDLSTEYGDTMLPLLTILQMAPVELDHIRGDDVALGKLVGAVKRRARSIVAQNLATVIVDKWTQLIGAAPSTPAQPTNGRPASSSSNTSAANKRAAPAASDAAASAAKKLKANTAAGSTAAKPSTAGKTPSSTASSSRLGAAAAPGKAGLSFFSSGNSTKTAAPPPKRPVTVSGSSVASKKTPGTSSAASSSKKDMLSILDSLHFPSAAKAEAAKKAEPESKAKAKKSVRWKDDADLVAVKLIEVAIYADEDEDEQAQHAEMAAKGIGALDHEEGSALRQAHKEMLEVVDWYSPPEVAFVHGNPERGCESVEAKKQDERTQGVLLAMYDEGQEPACPDESLVSDATTTAPPSHELATESREMTLGSQIEPFWATDEAQDAGHGDSAAAAVAAAATSTGLPIADLLAKLSGATSGLAPSAAPAEATSQAAAPAPLPSSSASSVSGFNFDTSMLHSILQQVKGKTSEGASAAAAVAADSSAPAPSSTAAVAPNVSALLANLTSTLGQAGVTSTPAPPGQPPRPPPASYEAGNSMQLDDDEGGGYWARRYREPTGSSRATPPQQQPQQQQLEQQQPTSALRQWGQRQPEYGAGGGGAGWNGGYNQDAGGGGGQQQQGFRSKKGTVQCHFWRSGTCIKGDRCLFRHGDP